MKKIIRSTTITSSEEFDWPEELTYEEYDEGDQIIEVFIDAVGDLGLYEEPSTSGGREVDIFYDDYNVVGEIGFPEEQRILTKLYWKSRSKEDFKRSVIAWLRELCKLD